MGHWTKIMINVIFRYEIHLIYLWLEPTPGSAGDLWLWSLGWGGGRWQDWLQLMLNLVNTLLIDITEHCLQLVPWWWTHLPSTRWSLYGKTDSKWGQNIRNPAMVRTVDHFKVGPTLLWTRVIMPTCSLVKNVMIRRAGIKVLLH